MPKLPSPRALGLAAKTAAQLAGHDKYEGQPCANGHTTRYSSTGACVQCAADRSTARRQSLRSTSREQLQAELASVSAKLDAALAAEARAWARVAELEDRYEPRHDPDLEPIEQERAA